MPRTGSRRPACWPRWVTSFWLVQQEISSKSLIQLLMGPTLISSSRIRAPTQLGCEALDLAAEEIVFVDDQTAQHRGRVPRQGRCSSTSPGRDPVLPRSRGGRA